MRLAHNALSSAAAGANAAWLSLFLTVQHHHLSSTDSKVLHVVTATCTYAHKNYLDFLHLYVFFYDILCNWIILNFKTLFNFMTCCNMLSSFLFFFFLSTRLLHSLETCLNAGKTTQCRRILSSLARKRKSRTCKILKLTRKRGLRLPDYRKMHLRHDAFLHVVFLRK